MRSFYSVSVQPLGLVSWLAALSTSWALEIYQGWGHSALQKEYIFYMSTHFDSNKKDWMCLNWKKLNYFITFSNAFQHRWCDPAYKFTAPVSCVWLLCVCVRVPAVHTDPNGLSPRQIKSDSDDDDLPNVTLDSVNETGSTALSIARAVQEWVSLSRLICAVQSSAKA